MQIATQKSLKVNEDEAVVQDEVYKAVAEFLCECKKETSWRIRIATLL